MGTARARAAPPLPGPAEHGDVGQALPPAAGAAVQLMQLLISRLNIFSPSLHPHGAFAALILAMQFL